MDQSVVERAQALFDEAEKIASPLSHSCNTCSLLVDHDSEYFLCTAQPIIPANTMQYVANNTQACRLISKKRFRRWPNTQFIDCPLWKEK